MTAAGLDIRGLRIELRRDQEQFALHVPLLAARPGEMIALVGRSGAGKSTLLEFLALLTRPAALDRYALVADGEAQDLTEGLLSGDLGAYAHLRAGPVGYVAQNGGLLPFLSARENALMSLRAAGLAMDADGRRRFDEAAERLGIAGDLDKRRAELSGGERKRVALLRVLSRRRALIVADEPTSGLDDATAEQVIQAFIEVARSEGTMVLAAMHDRDRAEAAGFRLAPIDRPEGATSARLYAGAASVAA